MSVRIAIETSTAHGSIAVGRGEEVLALEVLGRQTRHAEQVLPAIQRAMDAAGSHRGDVDAVVVGAGPGSFTGVRVAAATAKGLATSLGVPLLAYSSLLAVAVESRRQGVVAALFDARRGEVYAGCWRIDGDRIETLLAPVVAPVEEVVGVMAEWAPVYAGEGVARYRSELEDAGVPILEDGDEPVRPSAAALIRLAHRHPERGRVPDMAHWEPSYVRSSSAERGVQG